jgi:hypothetical protein
MEWTKRESEKGDEAAWRSNSRSKGTTTEQSRGEERKGKKREGKGGSKR